MIRFFYIGLFFGGNAIFLCELRLARLFVFGSRRLSLGTLWRLPLRKNSSSVSIEKQKTERNNLPLCSGSRGSVGPDTNADLVGLYFVLSIVRYVLYTVPADRGMPEASMAEGGEWLSRRAALC